MTNLISLFLDNIKSLDLILDNWSINNIKNKIKIDDLR